MEKWGHLLWSSELCGILAACGNVESRIHGSGQQDFQVGWLKLPMIKYKMIVIINKGTVQFSSKMSILLEKS